MDKINDGGAAFPRYSDEFSTDGMSLRDYFAAQVLANHHLCSGTAPEYALHDWFGHRGGLRREEIAAAQAYAVADAMLARRTAPQKDPT